MYKSNYCYVIETKPLHNIKKISKAGVPNVS